MDISFLDGVGVSKTTLEKISLSELTSLLVDSEAKIFIVAASSMWGLLRQVEVVNFIVLEVALAVLLRVSTEFIGKWEQTGALAHDIWKALLI